MFYGESRPSGEQYKYKSRSLLSAVKVNNIDDSLEVSNKHPHETYKYLNIVVWKLYRKRRDPSNLDAKKKLLYAIHLCVSPIFTSTNNSN